MTRVLPDPAPARTRRGPEAWRTVQDITRLNLETFGRIIVQRRPLTDEDLAPFRSTARERASADVPLEDLLHACRTGGRLVWQRVTAEARADEQAGLVAGADLIMEYLDSVSSAIAQAYLDERQHLVSEEDRKLRDLLEALSDPTALPSELAALAKEMSLPVLGEYRPFAVIMRDGGPRDHARIAKALREGRRIAGLVDPERARGLVGQPAVIALGDATQRADLSDALDEVRRLADLGRALGEWGELRPSQYLPELLLSASPRLAERLRRKAIGPLETYADRRGTDLLETLAAFVTNQCDRRATASYNARDSSSNDRRCPCSMRTRAARADSCRCR